MHLSKLLSITVKDRVYVCREREDIYKALVRSSPTRLPQGCRNGGCGLCKIRVLEGEVDVIGAQSRHHVTLEEEIAGVVLGCRSTPRGDVQVEVVGKLKNYLS